MSARASPIDAQCHALSYSEPRLFWLVAPVLMQAMQERDSQYLLRGIVQIDDACFGGELNGGKACRVSENNVPFVKAVEMNENCRPIRIKMSQVSGFTLEAIKAWTYPFRG